MRVVITGAAGFVASGVADAIANDLNCLGAPITDLVLADISSGTTKGHWITGDLSDPTHIAELFAEPIDVFLHLASLPGGMAETHPALGRAVNLTASLALMGGLAQQCRDNGPKARVVFASSIAAMGALGPHTVDETHPAAPNSSYGAHKQMIEIHIADLSRRKEIDGISLRLPGIVARPFGALGFGSAFMSDLFHAAAAAKPYSCPVSQEATIWWMSRVIAIDNILHAARLDTAILNPDRMVLLPALFASMNDVMGGLADHYGTTAVSQISFSPDPRIEALFGSYPLINNATALGYDFGMDVDVATLIKNTGI